MITYTVSNTDHELKEILDLQKQNLPGTLTKNEIENQGFVTVRHTFEDLKKLTNYEKQLVIKDGDKTIGYLLAMTKHSKNDIPALLPLFEVFSKISYRGKPVSDSEYVVVGQVCIAKDYRGMGLPDEAYKAYKNLFKDKYDFAITEIAVSNQRSIHAHKRIGFTEVHRYTDANHVEWSVVILAW